MTTRLSNFLISITNIVLSIISFFIGVRIILQFISANSSTPVVSWIYSVSRFLISPFRGLTSDIRMGPGSLDMVAIIALVSYMIAGLLLIEIFRKLALATIMEESAPATVHYHDLEEDDDLIDEEETVTRKHRHSR